MKEQPIQDARGGDHVLAEGAVLKKLIRGTVGKYQDQHKAILDRMDNEMPDKKSAVALMVSLRTKDALTAQALFFQACIEKAAWLDEEIRSLTTLGQTFVDSAMYRITVADARRMGL